MVEAPAERLRRGRVALPDEGTYEGTASVFTSISGLTNTIIGAGMLALPHAYASTGWFLGTILVVLCAVVSDYGLYLVKLCVDHTGTRVNSYYDLTSKVIPGAVSYFDATIFAKCFGVGVSYLMIAGHLMPQVVVSLLHAVHLDTDRVPAWFLGTPFWIGVFLCLLAPVCFYRKIGSLSFVGYLNMGAVAYLVLILLCYLVSPTLRADLPPKGEVAAWVWSVDVLRSLPIIIFAYTCAQNILPVYNELENSTVERAALVTRVSMGASAVVYLLVATAGYLTLGSKASDNIIAMYPDSSFFVCLGKVAVIALTLTSYPVQLYPCRASFLNLLEVHFPATSLLAPTTEVLDTDGLLADPLLHREVNDRRWVVVTVFLMLLGMLTSITINDLSTVLGFVGAVGCTIVSFILPALLYFRMFHEDTQTRTHKLALALGVWGALVLVLALGVNLAAVL